MMIKSIKYILFAVFLSPTYSYSSEFENKEQIKKFISEFMESTMEDGVLVSFDTLMPYFSGDEQNLKIAAIKSKEQRDAVRMTKGKSFGFEILREDPLGSSLVRYKVLEKTNRGGFYWDFYFYKGKDTWTLVTFKWTDKLQAFYVN
ncbi:hypothetical protein DV711_10910 [Motiliproteus coralliicola]|uniref:Nuclear transport factor 2 family protein n=1 Tax=Motiliproteus coralliicola TaxID=2283196 RepID=A0A369WBL9_9GAMM|nr:hypothetical protein [Motiliproteus coralliicola]RDE19400.1 hypothetical protein DV711_10910 [Motiliproteus coralliicola]